MTAVRSRLVTGHFALLFCITFLTFFAAFQLFPTVPLRLIELGATVGQSGRFMAVFTAGSAFGALFTGPLGDAVGQRRMIVVTSLLFAGFLISYGLISGPWWWLCVLALPHGIVWSGLLTATMATLGGVLPEDRRADGLTLYGLASPFGAALGSWLGLVVFRRWGFSLETWTLGAIFLVLALVSFSLPHDHRKESRRSPFGLPETVVLAPCAVLMATALGYGVLGSYTAQEALKLQLAMPGAFLFFMGIGMVAIRLVLSFRGLGPEPVRKLPRMLWLAFVGLVLLALAPSDLPRHIVSALIYGAGYGMVHTLISTYVLDVVHPERRGAAFGATLFSFDMGIGLGTFAIGGFIGWADGRYGVTGFRMGWGLSALMALAAVPLAYRMLRKARTPQA